MFPTIAGDCNDIVPHARGENFELSQYFIQFLPFVEQEEG